jgi:phytoene/squalene synthetase
MDNFEAIDAALADISPTYSRAIKILPSPIKTPVKVTMAAFRTLDCIEDLLPKEERPHFFDLFFNALNGADVSALSSLENRFDRVTHTKQDRTTVNLVRNTVGAFRSLEEGLQHIIMRQAIKMREGMENTGCIITLADQDRYCDAVAGTVGDVLTDVFRLTGYVNVQTHLELSRRSHDFGRALQKMNIIKDTRKDKALYWPSELLSEYGMTREDMFSRQNRESLFLAKGQLLRDARPYLDSALEYIKTVPNHDVRIRSFLMLSLFYYATVFKEASQESALLDNDIKVDKSILSKMAVKMVFAAPRDRAVENLYKSYIS